MHQQLYSSPLQHPRLREVLFSNHPTLLVSAVVVGEHTDEKLATLS